MTQFKFSELYESTVDWYIEFILPLYDSEIAYNEYTELVNMKNEVFADFYERMIINIREFASGIIHPDQLLEMDVLEVQLNDDFSVLRIVLQQTLASNIEITYDFKDLQANCRWI